MIQEDVLDIASRYLQKVRRVGNDNISALCPFHSKADGSPERNPSFSMSLSKGVWHCWSCKSSGTFNTFLHDIGVPRTTIVNQYGEVFEALKKNYSPAFDPMKPSTVEENPLPEAILGLFDLCPLAMVDPEAALALDQDDPVVFDEALLLKYDVGFDSKHNRITFPLRDYTGNLLGISGRTVIGEFPRYKVYDREYQAWGYPVRRETKKGSLLWNAHRVYPGVFLGSSREFVLVVEGFRACLWAIQCGFKNTVALLGSSLSKQQKWVLERMGAQVYLMLDNDAAGQQALRGRVDEEGRKRPGIAEELNKALDVKIVQYMGKQPTRLTQEAFVAAVQSATDYYRWVVC